MQVRVTKFAIGGEGYLSCRNHDTANFYLGRGMHIGKDSGFSNSSLPNPLMGQGIRQMIFCQVTATVRVVQLAKSLCVVLGLYDLDSGPIFLHVSSLLVAILNVARLF